MLPPPVDDKASAIVMASGVKGCNEGCIKVDCTIQEEREDEGIGRTLGLVPLSLPRRELPRVSAMRCITLQDQEARLEREREHTECRMKATLVIPVPHPWSK